MNATELFLKDGRGANCFFCGTCRIVKRTQDEAEECCKPRACSQCGTKLKERQYSCDICFQVNQIKKEKERFEASTKLTPEQYDGWVYMEGTGREGYSESLTELIDELENDGQEFPEYVWACTEKSFVHVSISDIADEIENCGDSYEDFDFDDLKGIQELKAALEAFTAENTESVSFYPDYSRAVILDKP